jgi:hypothetical protein
MLQPIITRGIKIKTTFDTSTPAITAAISPIPATMAATPKAFSPVRRTDLGYPENDAVTREACPRSASPASRRAPLGASDPPRSRYADRRRRDPRVAPELADPVGSLGSGSNRTWSGSARGSGPRGSRLSRESAVGFLGTHCVEPKPSARRTPPCPLTISGLPSTDGASMPLIAIVPSQRGEDGRVDHDPRHEDRDDVQEGYVDDFHVILRIQRSISSRLIGGRLRPRTVGRGCVDPSCSRSWRSDRSQRSSSRPRAPALA